jgi:pimeloyl-ACP methyl ester carboxylesterase
MSMTTQRVVMVHGSPGGPRSWSAVQRALHERCTGVEVATPTLPGHARGDLPADPALTLEDRGRELVGAVRAGDTPVVLVGHSFGAVVAVAALLDAPELIERAVLLEPVALYALPWSGDADLDRLATTTFEGYINQVERGDPDAVATMIDFWFAPGAYAALPDKLRSFFAAGAPANARDVRAVLDYRPGPDAFAACPVPVTIVLGTRSPAASAQLCRNLAGALPAGRVIELAGANHAMADTHAEAIADLIVDG